MIPRPIYLRQPSYDRAPFFSPECLETDTQVSTFLPEYKMPSLVLEGDAATLDIFLYRNYEQVHRAFGDTIA